MLGRTNQYNSATAEIGPHGGPLLAVDDGFVELSVFETNVNRPGIPGDSTM